MNRTLWVPGRRAWMVGMVLWVAMAGVTRPLAAADPAPAPAVGTAQAPVPDDPDRTWQRIAESSARQPKPAWTVNLPTPEQVKTWRSETMRWAGENADAAGAFARQFPRHPKAAEARATQFRLLRLAGNYGDPARRAEFKALEKQLLADPATPVDQKSDIRVQQLQEELARVRPQGRAVYAEAYAQGLLAIQRDLPASTKVYSLLYAAAQSTTNVDSARRIAAVITNAPAATPDLKERARRILGGSVISPQDRVGKPLDLKFTALDGRSFDLASLRGRVVVLDFWSAASRPNVLERSRLRETAGRLEARGLAVVGLSQDRSRTEVEAFLAGEGTTWTQFFDPKGPDSTLMEELGVRAVPEYWIIGRDGRVREVGIRDGLEARVERILREP